MIKAFLAAYAPWLYGGLAAIILGLAGWLYLKGRHDADAASKARAAAATQTRQAQITQATNTAVDHYTHDVTILHDRTEKAADAIRKAPTAQDALDPGYRASLCDQLAGVRGTAVCIPDDHHSVDASGGLPGAGF
jgi:hypothetical protein